jgi:hypothetical protein
VPIPIRRHISSTSSFLLGCSLQRASNGTAAAVDVQR